MKKKRKLAVKKSREKTANTRIIKADVKANIEMQIFLDNN